MAYSTTNLHTSPSDLRMSYIFVPKPYLKGSLHMPVTNELCPASGPPDSTSCATCVDPTILLSNPRSLYLNRRSYARELTPPHQLHLHPAFWDVTPIRKRGAILTRLLSWNHTLRGIQQLFKRWNFQNKYWANP